jgi:hypothetical protein
MWIPRRGKRRRQERKIRQNGNLRVRGWICEPDERAYVPMAAIDQALDKNGVGKATFTRTIWARHRK